MTKPKDAGLEKIEDSLYIIEVSLNSLECQAREIRGGIANLKRILRELKGGKLKYDF